MKPSQIEDLHVPKHEANFRMQQLQEKQQEATQIERCFLKRLHWMRCPKYGLELTIEHRGAVEIDVCPACRGVWLDAKELETIVATESSFVRSCVRILLRR